MAAPAPVSPDDYIVAMGKTQATTAAGWPSQRLNAAATTTLKTGPGILHGITIGLLGTVASTVTVYDNTAASGTILAVVNSLLLSGSFLYDIPFTTGLTIVVTGTVAPDLTVMYR